MSNRLSVETFEHKAALIRWLNVNRTVKIHDIEVDRNKLKVFYFKRLH